MNLFGGLQQAAAAQLAADPFYTGAGYAPAVKPIPVVYEQLGDIQNQVAIALGQLGIITVVLTVSGRESNPNTPKPYFKEIRLVARTQENVRINRSGAGTGQSASVVAEASGLILHRFTPAGLNASLFLQELVLVPNKNLFTWDAVFSLQAGMTDPAPVRLPWPAPPGSPAN